MSPSLPTRVHKLRWLALLFVLRLLPGSAAAAPAPDATDRFYNPESVQTIHLEIKSEDMDRLQRALPRRISVPGWRDSRRKYAEKSLLNAARVCDASRATVCVRTFGAKAA